MLIVINRRGIFRLGSCNETAVTLSEEQAD